MSVRREVCSVHQWRRDSSPLSGETQEALTIATAQLSDSGAAFDVVVANASTSQTSDVAVLTVRAPESLAWSGQTNSDWDTTTGNWLNLTSSQVAAYGPGDSVLFDSRGSSAPAVNLPGPVAPGEVLVNAATDYTLTATNGLGIFGNARLSKAGAGTLVLDANCPYSGSTDIEAGVLQVGAGNARGSIGAGPITNNSGLVFNRTGSLLLSNTISGSGSFTNITGNVTLSGTNTCSGPVTLNGGAWRLASPSALGYPNKIRAPPLLATGPDQPAALTWEAAFRLRWRVMVWVTSVPLWSAAPAQTQLLGPWSLKEVPWMGAAVFKSKPMGAGGIESSGGYHSRWFVRQVAGAGQRQRPSDLDV